MADAAVFGIPDDEMGEQVKAAVELADGVEASATSSRPSSSPTCREHLAGYKAPRSIDFEAAAPHPTGKLYKRLLRDPYWEDVGRTI